MRVFTSVTPNWSTLLLALIDTLLPSSKGPGRTNLLEPGGALQPLHGPHSSKQSVPGGGPDLEFAGSWYATSRSGAAAIWQAMRPQRRKQSRQDDDADPVEPETSPTTSARPNPQGRRLGSY